MYRLVKELRMKEIRQLNPLLPKLNDWITNEIDLIYDIATILIISDKTKEQLKKEFDNLDIEWFQELSKKIVDKIKEIDNIKKKQKI